MAGMIFGAGTDQEIVALAPVNTAISTLQNLAEMIHGERAASSSQKARTHAAIAQAFNNFQSRGYMTGQDFNLIYHAAR